jgi:glycosyltransferase involved in cell wall biosynthesis
MFRQNNIVAIVPARDEASSIGQVIRDIRAIRYITGEPVFDRVLVCDNGSSDDTAVIAESLGACVIDEPTPGYGAACFKALSIVGDTDIVVFIDADQSLDIDEARILIEAVCNGADLAIGSRPRDLREAGSMTLPQCFGNWLASRLIRLFWGVRVTDLGPFRAIRWPVLLRLKMQDRGYGWTVEMQVKAIQHGFKMVEVPVHYYHRVGKSKISGTVGGVIGAGIGIVSTIFRLALNPVRNPHHRKTPTQLSSQGKGTIRGRN